MLNSTCCLNNLIWHSCNVEGHQLIRRGAKAELPVLTSSTDKEATNIIDERRMVRASTYLFDICPVVLVKVDSLRCVYL
jgi:hypothetical protein